MAVPTLAASAWSELWANATAAGRQTGWDGWSAWEAAMPVEFGIWRIDGGLRRVPFIKLGDECRLEDILVRDVSVLGLDVMVVGRQVATSYGKRIDLLAIDARGDLYAIELKRDRTPREVVAQLLAAGGNRSRPVVWHMRARSQPWFAHVQRVTVAPRNSSPGMVFA